MDLEGLSHAHSRLRKLPHIQRARDFRLYAAGGARIVDCWQQNGRAILGHTPRGVLVRLKNVADRGLFSAFPSPWEGRLAKILGQLLPRYCFRFYASAAALQEAISTQGFAQGSSLENPRVALWRPFLESSPSPGDESPALLCIPLLPVPEPLQILALDNSLDSRFPPGDLIPPVVLAPAIRGIAALIAATPARGNPRFPLLDAAIPKGPWTRRGIYLALSPPPLEAVYDALWDAFLAAGFLLPPHPEMPLILPGILSKGEEAKLAALLASRQR